MNIPKLKGKMVEMGYTPETPAAKIGLNRSTLYRKFENGDKFTVGEARILRDVLDLSNEDSDAIFFN